ncbi:PREDICTED: protein tamozhennic [Dinoponera quadriceps]|uniref:Protein tamozhennic n=1 Tax=Dinoponera quadriceps TaxID=609295 RepID=A0A6P3X2T8_DINQU|nr:PREDICTED: protein tamozhennic [Dinoponera quadriceps]XP_014472169.1 PREDICTED: protein tamozhennic [Dinoponera quadriceps]
MATDVIIRSKDRLQEISMKLEHSHLAYLQTDDSPLKLQQRHKLEGFIKEYLCLVPNENKYVFQETADILHRSAATVTDFSGYRAATAWSAISLYAANLLAQPWRKEYRTVRTYSGYYKHEVEANLIGAELMFEQMGYKHTGLGVLTLEGPIDPDKVSSVSRDAIVAFVECQILKQIWESVSQNYTISWLEVLEFRESNVGTPEQAIRALNYRFLEKLHQNRAVKTNSYKDYYAQQQQTSVDPVPLTAVPYQLMQPNYNAATMPPVCQTDYRRIEDVSNIVSANYRYYQPPDHTFVNCCNTYGCLLHGNKFYSGGVQADPYCATLPAYPPIRVPTGRLIELDAVPASTVIHYGDKAPRKSHRISDLDEVDFYRRQQQPLSDVDHYSEYGKTMDRKAASRSNSSVGRTRGDSYDTWDFVYKNLESQGYSKDLGEREDVLQHRKELDSRAQSKHRTLRTENEGKYSAHRSEKRRSGRSEANDVDASETNGRNHQDVLPFKKKSSSFDLSDSSRYNNSGAALTMDAYSQDKRHNQTLPMPRTHRSSDQIARIEDSLRNLDIARTSKDPTGKEGRQDANERRWNCGTCTYLNTPDRDICEMCGKSRYKGNEDKPLASGGKECPKCTLVNEKDVSICDACHASLKDSPTYI